MTEPGYVYLLINTSMQGMVKIGRTQRDPEARARELSAATGVPTPFILVFDAYFADSALAEQYVHTLLESKSYRVTSNREFFVAPVKEAISAIQEAQQSFRQIAVSEDMLSTDGPAPSGTPWQAILELADTAYFGGPNALQDEDEALRLYDQAGKLGSAEACLKAGQICVRSEALRDKKRALLYFKEGVRLGSGECHAEMAEVFASDRHIANWAVSSTKYFTSDIFLNGGPRVLIRGSYALAYLRQADHLRVPIGDLDHRDAIAAIKDEVFAVLDQIEALVKSGGGSGEVTGYLRTVASQVFETARRQGTVKWFNAKERYGCIALDEGRDVFFIAAVIMTPGAFDEANPEGLAVLCRVGHGPDGPYAYDVRVP